MRASAAQADKLNKEKDDDEGEIPEEP